MNDKQKEQSRRRQQRYRERQKSVTNVTQSESVTDRCDKAPMGANTLNAWAKMAGYTPKAKDFHSLPQDVQRSIMRISDSDEEVRQRTIIALDYQRQFPNSIHRGTGL